MPSIVGNILAVHGEVVEVEFFDQFPAIHDILVLNEDDKAELEVFSSASKNSFHCLVLRDSKAIRRGAKVISTGKSMTIPAGDGILGRAINLFGEPQDGKPLTKTELTQIFNETDLSLNTITVPNSIIETGIKAVDFFSPVLRGGKVGLFGGAGLGKTVLLTELINNVVIKTVKRSKKLYRFLQLWESALVKLKNF
jgi:F-type H+-transporting ATPase subunit beta